MTEEPTIDDYADLCREMYETLRACTPSPAVAAVIVADLAAQVVSTLDLVVDPPGALPNKVLEEWLATFTARFREVQTARRVVAPQLTFPLAPVTPASEE